MVYFLRGYWDHPDFLFQITNKTLGVVFIRQDLYFSVYTDELAKIQTRSLSFADMESLV